MRQVGETIHVQCSGGQPSRLMWRGGLWQVDAIEDCWLYAGKWWLDGKGWRRTYFWMSVRQVGKSRGGRSGAQVSLELYQQRGRWVLHRVLD